MNPQGQHQGPELQKAREDAAREERRAILQIIEGYARQLAHGHGVSGAQVLQLVADEIQRRETT